MKINVGTIMDARRKSAAMDVLFGFGNHTIHAAGTWATKNGESVFCNRGNTPILRMGRRWATLKLENETIEAEPVGDGWNPGVIVLTTRGKPRAGYTTSKRKGTPKRKRKIAAASRKRNRR